MKRLFSIGIIILFIGLSISSSTGFNVEREYKIKSLNGKTLYVGGSGPENYTKIQDAINDASDGDTVYVYDDSSPYYEHIIITKAITIKGEDKNTTIIDGSRKDDVVYISANNAIISGFTIQKSGNKGWQNGHDAGIDVQAQYCIISNNIIIQNYHGIKSSKSSNNTYFHNTISHNNAYGVVLWDDGYNNISFNTISKNENGIMVTYAKHNKVLNNIFISNENFGIAVTKNHNTISGNTFNNDGMLVDASSNIITNNTVNGKPLVYLENEINKSVEKQAGQIILVRCNNITIQNQEINNTYTGIQLLKSNNCIISNCTLSDNSNLGLDLESSNNNIFSNNVIKSNGWLGAVVFFSNNNTFVGNTISKNKIYGIWLIGSSDYNSFLSNNVEGNLDGGIWLSEFHNGDKDICPNNIIFSRNLIRLHRDGIYASMGTKNLTFLNNTITSNKNGISLVLSFNSTIKNNKISWNILGIGLHDSYSVIVKHNNFIRNLIHASFNYNFGDYDSNRWDYNFWNRPRLNPKPIYGFRYGPPRELWKQYDNHPALKPYNMEV
jgi:parallel beta-helix repeat protein